MSGVGQLWVSVDNASEQDHIVEDEVRRPDELGIRLRRIGFCLIVLYKKPRSDTRCGALVA